MKAKGFTLIEFLIVITILLVLSVLGFSNYLNSLKAGKDGRRKADLQAIQRALETYYQDNNAFPAVLPDTNGAAFCHPSGCATSTYMQILPKDPGGSPYVYISDGISYQLYSCIENANDKGPGVKQDGYGQSCGGGACNPCKYGISSTNTTP